MVRTRLVVSSLWYNPEHVFACFHPIWINFEFDLQSLTKISSPTSRIEHFLPSCPLMLFATHHPIAMRNSYKEGGHFAASALLSAFRCNLKV